MSNLAAISKYKSLIEAKAKSNASLAKSALKDHFDSVGQSKDGHIVARQGYFYSHGNDATKHAATVSAVLNKAGIKHDVVDKGDQWKPFRGGASIAQSSHFWAKVKVHESVNEAKRVPMYHSVFVQHKDGGWIHHFDADDKEDARLERDGIRNQGEKGVTLRVPKHEAQWHKMGGQGITDYVNGRLAKNISNKKKISE